MSDTQKDWLAEAYKLGSEYAANAASWTVDGNTKQEAIRYVLELIDDGDPAAEDYLPARPNLSGEWADDLTPNTLADEIGQTINDLQPDELAALCEAYEQGVLDTFELECERVLRAALADGDER